MIEVEKGYQDPLVKEWFFSYLNQKMSSEVYLSADSMKDQLNLSGISFGLVMSEAMEKEAQKIVRDMFGRRNKIVHQNDRDHASACRSAADCELVETFKKNAVDIVSAVACTAETK